MDPASGIGLFLPLLERLLEVASFAKELNQSPHGTGTAARYSATEIASVDLLKSIDAFIRMERVTNDRSLAKLAEYCCNETKELLALLQTLKVQGKRNKLEVVSKAFRHTWKEKDINNKLESLERLKVQLITHISFSQTAQLASVIEKLEDIAKLFPTEATIPIEDDRSHETLSELEHEEAVPQPICAPHVVDPLPGDMSDVQKHAEDAPYLLDNSLNSQPVQDSSALCQSLVSIRAPSRFRCNGAACACGCHLGQAYKTPLFLRRFIGALSFRGVCANHPTAFFELKYWAPEWVSKYNIYLLYQRSTHGAPSIGLKFQRKVPWGREDTIIRFSFVGDTEGIKAILQSGRGCLDDIDPNGGRSALHLAVQKNHIKACRLLLQAGADRFAEDESNTSATQKAWEHIFSNRGSPEVLDDLGRLFPSDELEQWQFSPVHKALLGIGGLSLPTVLQGDRKIEMINATDGRGRTPLHWATLRGDLKAAELLLDNGADIGAIDELKYTPLLYAVSSDAPRIVELLILRRADVNVVNGRGDSPLHFAARHRDDAESVKILIQAGARVDGKNNLGNTPFTGAAIMNRLSSGEYLLQNGASKDSSNKYGDTPLRETIHHNRHEFLQMLLREGARYDTINKSGSSILHAVALEGDAKTVAILKAADMVGLDVDLRNNNGQTAMDVCEKRITAPEGFRNAFLELIASCHKVQASGG